MAGPDKKDFPPRMTIPVSGWQASIMTNQDGARLRYGIAPSVGEPRAAVVLVTGFNEVIDKYHETISDLTKQGLRVYALDWRGQGGSQRWDENMPQRPLPVDYAHDVRDLHDFVTGVVGSDPATQGKKKFLVAHSMGGHIGLRTLHDHPDLFDGMTTTAPMLGIRTRPFPRPVAVALARTMTNLGQGHRYIPGGSDWVDDETHLALKNLHSSDPLRRQLHHMLYRDHPSWRHGDATFRWLNTAFNSLSIVHQPHYAAAIQTPVLMAVAGRDHLIDPLWQHKFARSMPGARVVTLPESGHEIWHETDAIRGTWLQYNKDFISDIIAAPVPVPQNKPGIAPKPC